MSYDSQVEQELIKLSHEWMDTWQRRDEARLNEILADDFTLASSLTTDLMGRMQWLDYALHHYGVSPLALIRRWSRCTVTPLL